MRIASMLQCVAEEADVAIVLTDIARRITYASRTAADLLGLTQDEIVGRPLAQFLEIGRPDLAEQLHSEPVGRPSTEELWVSAHCICGQRSPKELEIAASELCEAEGIRVGDIIMLRPAKSGQPIAQPAPAGYDESFARLAGEFAHDFDNVLAIVSGHLQIAELRSKDDGTAENLRQALLACQLGHRMTQSLKAIGHRQSTEQVELSVNDVVTPLARALLAPFRNRIDLALCLADALPPVRADRTAMEGAILNILINAVDAMPDRGTITITTSDETSGTRRFVRIVIKDTGVGMPHDVAARALEPFYSTKPPGQNSGLGLASVAGFARHAGGTVALTSEVGAGTSITLRLPAMPGGHPHAFQPE